MRSKARPTSDRNRVARPAPSSSYHRAAFSRSASASGRTMNRRGIESATIIELPAESFLNNLPAVAGVWIGLQVLQAFIEDFVVPIGNGNRLGRGCDMVPQ